MFANLGKAPRYSANELPDLDELKTAFARENTA
jgi:hypothetical protein